MYEDTIVSIIVMEMRKINVNARVSWIAFARPRGKSQIGSKGKWSEKKESNRLKFKCSYVKLGRRSVVCSEIYLRVGKSL